MVIHFTNPYVPRFILRDMQDQIAKFGGQTDILDLPQNLCRVATTFLIIPRFELSISAQDFSIRLLEAQTATVS